MEDRDGGPAFSGTWFDNNSIGEIVPREFYPGMSLRDYFAEGTKNSLIVNWMRMGQGMIAQSDYAEIAKEAYEIADAMLEARKRS